MPVLAEHAKPSMGLGDGDHSGTTKSTSSAYLFISLAILFALGIAFSLRQSRSKKTSYTSDKNSTDRDSFITSRRTFPNARMMQEPTPPTSAASALPEKPYLPNPDAMEHKQATREASNRDHEHEKSVQEEDEERIVVELEPFYSPQLQHFPSHERQHNVIVQAKAMPLHQPPPFHTRLGLLPAVTTSLLHPEPPSPTITMVSTKIQTYAPSQSQSQLQNQNQIQSRNVYEPAQAPYQLPTPTHTQMSPQQSQQNQYQPYMQNEILFVPSPTEYTSFEALYSKFPPTQSASNAPIYQSPNPASYASTTFPAALADQDGAGPSVPRRRSYIKALSNGSEMSGEVVEAAGQWRRHTRVFGGGVCIACEESERRMSA